MMHEKRIKPIQDLYRPRPNIKQVRVQSPKQIAEQRMEQIQERNAALAEYKRREQEREQEYSKVTVENENLNSNKWRQMNMRIRQ